ncbi:MAG: MoaD/ThiS family protein [Pseudomonadota bacterium]
MSITVRFFASLREELGDNKTLQADQVQTVADIWKQFSQKELGNNILISINMEYVNADQGVNDGDEVAFFPPVTGG